MGSAAKRVWRAVPHDGGTGAQDRWGDFATRRWRLPRGMAAQSGRSPGPSRDTRRCGGEGPIDRGSRRGAGLEEIQAIPIYVWGGAARNVGGVVSPTMGYRVGHSISEADLADAQSQRADAGDGGKGTAAGNRRS